MGGIGDLYFRIPYTASRDISFKKGPRTWDSNNNGTKAKKVARVRRLQVPTARSENIPSRGHTLPPWYAACVSSRISGIRKPNHRQDCRDYGNARICVRPDKRVPLRSRRFAFPRDIPRALYGYARVPHNARSSLQSRQRNTSSRLFLLLPLRERLLFLKRRM